MKLNKLSMGVCAASLLAVAAPLFAQTVSADNADASLASGSAGTVSDGHPGSGNSKAEVGFKAGSLVLRQVPNFGFGKENTINTGKISLSESGDPAANRVAIVVDNRSTPDDTSSAAVPADGWKLSASIGSFQDTTDTTNTRVANIPVLYNPTGVKALDFNNLDLDGTAPVSVSDESEITNSSDRLSLPGSTSTLTANGGGVIATVHRYGTTGIQFAKDDNVQLNIGTLSNLSGIVSGHVYNADVTWNLTTDVTQSQVGDNIPS
ncbi:hypothetical protein MOO45_06545 [Bombilactobacillus folatiphilus]|uniref:WxL domain-containing protein n=1 Tax=Bombilactobacillus folatiphilus TaxID=2923362 RepID=A0ABY4P874_9LACO|nr:hypothetical protein [Bombilactobacillus folatiphilus]UQS81848.1 hypothetical protein MOO45_06545 [Bombilactobacillus folatiphilus]